MAAIDKIYIEGYDNYKKFADWCAEQPPFKDKYGKEARLTDYLYKYDKPFADTKVAFCAPEFLDAYIIRNCPFDFIQDELKVNYGKWTQKTVEEAYKTVMERGGKEGDPDKDLFSWMTSDDFEVIDGLITRKYEDVTGYDRIMAGELYATPRTTYKFTVGKHLKCIKHPPHRYEKPFGVKKWWVSVKSPDGMPSMWYHYNTGTWDFMGEFVISDWSSSHTGCTSVRSMIRNFVKKWELPVGAEIELTGRYSPEIYIFSVKK